MLILRVPTPDETLRITGYLIVRRNRVRDYLDVASLADKYRIAHAADVLRHIDAYWRRLATAIRADPWGPVARQVLEAVHLSHPYGTTELLEGVVARARELAADSERTEVASEVRALVAGSAMSKAGLRGADRNLAVPAVDLHVRPGRALSNLDGADAAGRASRR